ncbi:TBC1 domain family member 15-like protein [Drosera capensis]
MLETELHDLSDDADYAASQQQGSQSMIRSDSGKRIEPEGAEVVYVKENVSVHPTQYMSERISGRLKLIKQGDSLFMSWIPYRGQNSSSRLSEKGEGWILEILSCFAHADRNLYTIRLVEFTEVRSIRRHTPALGWQYVIIVLSSGLAYPPLYFYNGGVKEFLATIKQHVFLKRSADDANVFIVNDFQDPLQRTLSSLELPGVVSVANSPSRSNSVEEAPLLESVYDNTSSSEYNVKQKLKHDPGRDLSIQVLEKFSLVTKFARDTTSQLFRENSDSNLLNGRRKHEQHLYDSFPKLSNDVHKIPDDIHEHDHSSTLGSSTSSDIAYKVPVPVDPLEFEKLVLVWGKPRQPPLAPDEWAASLDPEGRVKDPKALKKKIFYGGIEHELRKQVWPFLLGHHAYDSTYAEREYHRAMKKQDYETIKRQWQSISPQQAKRFTKFRERKGLIEKDVVRTDRSLGFYDGDENPNVNLLHDILLTYSFYNFDLGYCQGMSDFLSPIVYVTRDESEAFWCFSALMERLGPNFNRDQSGMHSQLFAISKLVEILDSPLHNYFKQNDCLNYFFCFRWILIQFKRELKYEETIRMWEVLWTHHLSEHLHLYVCVAILKRYRSKIMGEQMDFDTLLKFINELSGHINLDATLKDAEALCICAGENGEACIPPGTPPSLPMEETLVSSQLEDEYSALVLVVNAFGVVTIIKKWHRLTVRLDVSAKVPRLSFVGQRCLVTGIRRPSENYNLNPKLIHSHISFIYHPRSSSKLLPPLIPTSSSLSKPRSRSVAKSSSQVAVADRVTALFFSQVAVEALSLECRQVAVAGLSPIVVAGPESASSVGASPGRRRRSFGSTSSSLQV